MTAPTRFADGHYAAGQPTPADLAGLAREGVRTVINLRGTDEPVDYDEPAEAARLGLRYVALPITGPGDLDRERLPGGREAEADALLPAVTSGTPQPPHRPRSRR